MAVVKKRIAVLVSAIAAAVGLSAGLSGCVAGTGVEEPMVVEDGVLTVGLSPDFPPMEYLDPKTNELVGVDVEISKEIGRHMGLDVKFSDQSFDQLITSVRTERVDIVFSGLSDTVIRQQTVDLIDYFKSVGRFYTTPENAKKFTSTADICGQPVAVSVKTDYYEALLDLSKKECEAKGKAAVKIVGADSGAAARLQLDQGRAVLAAQGAENLAYFESTDPGKYKIVLGNLTESPFAAVVRKDNDELSSRALKALQEMKADGSMEKILKKYKVDYGLMAPAVNGVKE